MSAPSDRAASIGASLSLCALTLLALVGLRVAAPAFAQPPGVVYIYDDLGRLVRVVNQSNNCATYEYDAAGNILRITRQTNCLRPPSIAGVSAVSGRAGEVACLTIDGSNLLGAVVTTHHSEIAFERVRATDTRLEFCLDISYLAPVGPTPLTITTPGGAIQQTFNVVTPAETLLTGATTIGPRDQRFEGTHLVIDGTAVTIDGEHLVRSLTLRNGATVTHSAATASTRSRLDLMILGTLAVDATSRIDVSGKGFVGALAPGLTCQPFVSPPVVAGCHGQTVGHAPGSRENGSHGGAGANSGSLVLGLYGDFRGPVDLGSGGGAFGCGLGCQAGGSGGGAVRIEANEIVLDGSILGNGQAAAYAGSGGSIWLLTHRLAGSGVIEASGARGGDFESSSGGGRVAIYYSDAGGFDFSRVRAFGGTVAQVPAIRGGGGAGTIFLKSSTQTNGHLIIDNGDRLAVKRSTVLPTVQAGALDQVSIVKKASFVLGDPFSPNTDMSVDDAIVFGTVLTGRAIRVSNSASLEVERVQAAALNLTSQSTLTHPTATPTRSHALVIETGTLDIDATSSIDVTARGLLGASQEGNDAGGFPCRSGRTVGNVNAGGSDCGAGGSYGGVGGAARFGPAGNDAYGDYRDPKEPGSGGGSWSFLEGFSCNCPAGNGGGVIHIVATDIHLNGIIRADGGLVSSHFGGAGSGGAIRITTSTLRGPGTISATGGSHPGGADGGGGGGGRIAVFHGDMTLFTGALRASGGTQGRAGSLPGGAGTIFFKQPTQAIGDLVIDNHGIIAPPGTTPLRAIGSGVSTALSSNTLAATSATFAVPDAVTGRIGLVGLELNPNRAQNQTFTIVDNTSTTLTTDPADGLLTAVAAAGDAYTGVYRFGNLSIRNHASVTTADRCLVDGTLETTYGTLICENLQQYAVPGNVLADPGFESGPAGGWTEFSNTSRQLINTTRPRLGSFSAELCRNNSCTESIEQTLTVPPNGLLTYFWYKVPSGVGFDSDRLDIALYGLDGTLITTLRSLAGADSEGNNAWVWHSISLSDYAGQTVRLRFTATTEPTFGPTTFYFDDIGVAAR